MSDGFTVELIDGPANGRIASVDPEHLVNGELFFVPHLETQDPVNHWLTLWRRADEPSHIPALGRCRIRAWPAGGPYHRDPADYPVA